MKALILSLCAALGLALTAGPAHADHRNRNWNRGYNVYPEPWASSWAHRPLYFQQQFYSQPFYGPYNWPGRWTYPAPYIYGPQYGFGFTSPGVSIWFGR